MNSPQKQHAISLIATFQLCFAFAPKSTILGSCRSCAHHDGNRAARDELFSVSRTTDYRSRRSYHTPLSESSAASSDDTSSTSVYECKSKGQRFDRETFAKSNCWGRRPFLMRKAFDQDVLLESRDEADDAFWPSWEGVVVIASDDDSESRVITHKPGDDASYELQWGPLAEEDVEEWITKAKASNERKSTLVVNDIDRFYPPLADWIHDNFQFIPNWRMDDGQISLAHEMGGIGPHVDNYDVFLIQMSGRRRWQVGRRVMSVKEEIDRTIEGLDVRVLDCWGKEDEFEGFVLEPGDLLYLPPRTAHCGTALSGDCMTLSVGCRAPSVSDLVSRIAEKLATSIKDNVVRRYTDEDLLTGDMHDFSAGHLTNESKQKARKLVLDSVTSVLGDDDWWDGFFGKYVTEQKRVRMNYPIPLDDVAVDEDEASLFANAEATVQSVLDGKAVLYHAEGIAFAYSCVQKGSNHTVCRLFANGEMWQGESDIMACIYQSVASHRRIDDQLLLSCCMGAHSIGDEWVQVGKFLEELVKIGVLYGAES